MSKKVTVKGNVAKPILEVPTSTKKFVTVVLMALYQFANNGLVSGRTGGDVKMRNGRSRGMRVPALVRNTYTGRARGVLSTMSSNWTTVLNAAQRLLWLNYEVSSSDRFGVVHTYKGKTAYVRLNANLSTAGAVIITAPPVLASAGKAVDFSAALAISAGGATFDINNTANSDGLLTLVYATTSLSAGISRPSKSAYRLIGVASTLVASTDIWAAYVAKFGVPAIGANIFVQVRTIGATTGLSSAPTNNFGVVAA